MKHGDYSYGLLISAVHNALVSEDQLSQRRLPVLGHNPTGIGECFECRYSLHDLCYEARGTGRRIKRDEIRDLFKIT